MLSHPLSLYIKLVLSLSLSLSLSLCEMADDYDLSIFVDCSPICSDVSADPELEALQAEYKRSKSKSKDQAKNEPDEAQSSLRSLAEKNVAKGASENPPPPPLPPPPPPSAVLEENPRKRKGRPPKMVVLQEQLELEGYPSWLPSGWVILRNTRVNGRSAGHVDKRRMKEIRAMAVKAFPAMSKPKCAVVVDCIALRI
ncbi:unnamed protein product [Camellia sinensis]